MAPKAKASPAKKAAKAEKPAKKEKKEKARTGLPLRLIIDREGAWGGSAGGQAERRAGGDGGPQRLPAACLQSGPASGPGARGLGHGSRPAALPARWGPVLAARLPAPQPLLSPPAASRA